MDDSNKQARTRQYQNMNFGGTTDWAVDLSGDVGGLVYAAANFFSSVKLIYGAF